MSPFSTALMQGWLTGAGLIVAIGAQNALVLRQGLMRQHVAPVVFVCAISDILLICLGVFGLGRLIAASPLLMEVFRWGGAAFLLSYSVKAGLRALSPKAGLQAQAGSASLGAVLGSTLAMTYLNPHVYLDTVVLLGTVGAQQPEGMQAPFAAGASVASWMWFSLLGFGAAAVAGPLRRPAVWRSIDALIAIVMAVLGLQLILRPLA
ncbi:MAG: amino acid transporter [Mitsuaria chitosanitabida]|uniref:LysE/ArgO family amino acid transporter n=1 Tax=Roseateles chitosanitabidus TaxID=65048 RepID=UPI001B0B4617|nr:LysE/ArgO family amino acid transporter [Roseateles chitosanitabidus]MBO9687992.1 amino acid transporter [Roseateles chitosanitabidus]